jgi:hypothetical protein
MKQNVLYHFPLENEAILEEEKLRVQKESYNKNWFV